MLKQINISSTLAMLYPCEKFPARHTIVEVEYEKGWMAVDPVYNLFFPAANGSYYGMKELGGNHQLLSGRIKELRVTRGPKDTINYYSIDEATTFTQKQSIGTKTC